MSLAALGIVSTIVIITILIISIISAITVIMHGLVVPSREACRVGGGDGQVALTEGG